MHWNARSDAFAVSGNIRIRRQIETDHRATQGSQAIRAARMALLLLSGYLG
jgi:hypothetical protein